ncbi:MAG: molybdopterin-guanine dinucleotide biosynthesis protein B [Rhodospirillales bacterium]
MKVFGLVGWSGSGKTTLMTELLPELIGRGLRVSTMKHTHHNVDIDKPGKDSYEHRRAGATEVMLASSKRFALVHEYRSEPEEDMDSLIARMTPVDLLLIEGFKRHRHPKMEIFRPITGKEVLARNDDSIVAVATDGVLEGISQPLLDLNDVPAIADYILEFCGITAARSSGAA